MVAVRQPQFRDQCGFDLSAMKHAHHAALRDNDGDRPETWEIDAARCRLVTEPVAAADVARGDLSRCNETRWEAQGMSGATGRVLLWLFVLNLGISLGAGLYEHRIVLPDWIDSAPDGTIHWNAEAARQDNTGIRFWAFVTTGPLTLITLANLIAARKASGSLRTWWLIAAVAALSDRVITFAYFIPTMVGLMGQADSPEAVATATTWASSNYVRHAISLMALLAALKAFSIFYEQRGSVPSTRPAAA